MNEDDLSLSGYPSPTGPRPRGMERWEEANDDYARWRAAYERDLIRASRRRRSLGLGGTLLLSAVVLGLLAFVTAPLFAFRSIRSAAQFGDVQALNEQVDYDALRQSLRVQIRPASVEARPPAGFLRNPLEAMRRAWEPMTPQADVDRYLAAPALAAMMNGLGPQAAASEPEGLFGGQVPRVRYWGVDRTRLGVKPQAGGGETVFTLVRQGLFEWRLVGVKLPQATAA